MRGFEKISKEQNNENVILPQRQTQGSAGYDLYLPVDVTLQSKQMLIVPIGIKVYLQKDEVFYIFPRSSISIKKGIILANSVAVFDSDYYNNPDNEGEILLALYNRSDNLVTLKKGERVAQGVFQKILFIDDDSPITKERIGGIGSTSK